MDGDSGDSGINPWSRLTAFVWYLLDNYDDQAIFLLVFIEEMGIPLPVPGDLAMLVAGYRVSRGQMNLIWVLFLIQVAPLLGASILYWIGSRGGRPLIYRYGRYIHVDRAKLDRAEGFLQRRGILALVLGRLIPGLRIVTTLVAGILGVPYLKFLAATAVGSFVYILAFVLLGMWVGPHALETIAGPEFSIRLVLTLLLFLGLTGLLIKFYREAAQRELARMRLDWEPRRVRVTTALLAGFLATIEMGLGVNALVYLLSAVGVLRPEEALIRLVREAAVQYAGGSSAQFLLILFVILLLANLLWAPLFALVAVKHLPGSRPVQGLLFSLVPLAFSSFVLLPLMGAGPLGLGLDAGLVPLAGEVFRNTLYGVSLGILYTLLQGTHVAARRRKRSDADTGSPKPQVEPDVA